MNKLNLGDEIFVINPYGKYVYKGIVENIVNNDIYVKINSYFTNTEDKAEICNCEYMTSAEFVYFSIEEAFGAIRNNNDKLFKKYCKEMNDAKSMIEFAAKHCINGEEYTDWNAARAYQVRAKELFGIDLKLY